MNQREPDNLRREFLRLERRDRDGRVIVVASGEIDRESAPRFSRALAAAAVDTTGGRPLVVDLSQVGFLDAAGISALVAASGRTSSDGEGVRVVVGQARAVTRPIRVLGLAGRLSLYRTGSSPRTWCVTADV